MVIEGQLERTDGAQVPFGRAYPAFEVPALLARQFNLFELLQGVIDLVFGQFPRGEHDQLLAGFLGHLEKGAIIGEPFAVPRNHGEPLEPSRIAAENGKVGPFQVFEDFVLQSFEIQIQGRPAFASSE